MFRSLYTAASGMHAEQLDIDQISENLANANTTAYKKGRVDFQDLMYTAMAEPGALGAYGEAVPISSEIGSGVRASGFEKVFTPGELYRSGNPLDLAIHGNGFFQVTLEDGTAAYTRDGVIHLNKNGEAVIAGHPLAGLKIPQHASGIEVTEDGTVKAYLENPKQKEILGHIKLARFLNPAGLRYQGNVFLETPVSGVKVEGTPGDNGFGEVKSGYIEKANISLIEEMMKLVIAQRIYEFNAKAVEVTDNMMRMTTQGMQPK